jgi:SAM-dependent methyltransferase
MQRKSNPPKLHLPLYKEDLAHIHVEGYGFHWASAAEPILEWLRQFRIVSGTIIDLGCGGGQWLSRLTTEGYESIGIDVSESMIRMAKQNAPSSRFICGSFADVTLPACSAVTAMGEPLNYLASGAAIRRTMRNVFTAMDCGGVFIFDLRGASTEPIVARDHFKITEDWFCHARVEEDGRKNHLTRHITTFRRMKGETYRRDEEVHRLKIFPHSEVLRWLREIGFLVRTQRSYGSYKLGPRQLVFICRKQKS